MTELLCFNLFFYFKDTATTEIYTYGHTLSLHDALPILIGLAVDAGEEHAHGRAHRLPDGGGRAHDDGGAQPEPAQQPARSEEHTSELQSLMRISYAVFCLKKTNKHQQLKQHTANIQHKTSQQT